MAIPESQLDVWAKQGPIQSSKTTHESIRLALSANSSPIAARIDSGDIKVYLQGSYANDTNTRGDSDVDIIVELVHVFDSNKLTLPADQLASHEATYRTADYGWHQLRGDVVTALRAYYGTTFIDESGNKSVRVHPNSGRLGADVVPVTKYRHYEYFISDGSHAKVVGVHFYHRITGRAIVNFPTQHYDNGVSKHHRTGGRFKGVVRILKNARACSVDRGVLAADAAPSYFLQGLIYNVPDHLFTGNWQPATRAVLAYLHTGDLNGFICQNGVHPLFGEAEEQWSRQRATETITTLADLWDNWS